MRRGYNAARSPASGIDHAYNFALQIPGLVIRWDEKFGCHRICGLHGKKGLNEQLKPLKNPGPHDPAARLSGGRIILNLPGEGSQHQLRALQQFPLGKHFGNLASGRPPESVSNPPATATGSATAADVAAGQLSNGQSGSVPRGVGKPKRHNVS